MFTNSEETQTLWQVPAGFATQSVTDRNTHKLLRYFEQRVKCSRSGEWTYIKETCPVKAVGGSFSSL